MNRDLRRLVNTIRRMQQLMQRDGHKAIGVRLNEAGDEIINDPKGMVLKLQTNPEAFALKMLSDTPVEQRTGASHSSSEIPKMTAVLDAIRSGDRRSFALTVAPAPPLHPRKSTHEQPTQST